MAAILKIVFGHNKAAGCQIFSEILRGEALRSF